MALDFRQVSLYHKDGREGKLFLEETDMTEVKWLIEDGIFHADTAKLAEEVKRQGMDVQLIDYKYELMYGIGKTPKKFAKDECVVCLGSFQEIAHWSKVSSEWTIWCHYENFKCSSYFPYYGKYLLNRKYIMMPLNELIRQKNDIFPYLNQNVHPARVQEMEIFLRPDSGKKSFSGQLFKCADIDNHFIFDYIPNKNLMIIASSPREDIINEWRFLVVDKKVITGSQYHKDNEICIEEGFEDKAMEFAQNVVDNVGFSPDPAYTLDIAKTKDNKFHVVEINSFSCSDPYMANFEHYVREISNRVAKEFEDLKS